jgi:dihydroxyacetone kinase-like predicted kinase
MPEAIAALVVYDPEGSAEDNGVEMTDAANSVVTGEVTTAVRSTSSPAGPIAEGDWIGLVRGDGIVSVGTSMVAAATALLDTIVDDGAELVTVITGDSADDAATDEIRGWLREHRGDVAFEVQPGGQPLYPYLFGVE